MGRQEGGIWTDSEQEVLSMVSWDSGPLCAPRAWGCSFGKEKEIHFVAKCNLETTLSAHCCFAESMIEVKSVLGLKTKSRVKSAERRAISKFLN